MRRPLDEGTDASPTDASDIDERLLRPHAAAPLNERAGAWIEWFGLARLVTTAIAVVAVCGGAWFLLRTPPPPTEASLPVARSGSTPTVTLAVATSAPVSESTVVDGPVIVHVAGAVAMPGVYEIGSGGRVDDAVRRAGGATAAAELGRINLAAPLVDGAQIYVPEVGEVLPVPTQASPTGDADISPTEPIDVNRAAARELEALPGVGPATAAAIVAERERNGPFASFEELERVPGIGPAKLAGLVGLVTT